MRILSIAVSVAAVVGLAGCAGGETDVEGESSNPGSTLKNLDPCTVLKPEQLAALGLPSNGIAKDNIASEPGCSYSGESATITLYRNATKTLEEASKSPSWSEFSQIDVNGRPGVRAKNASVSESMCRTGLSVDQGIVWVAAQPSDPRKPFDGCVESLKVAKMIEPNLPK